MRISAVLALSLLLSTASGCLAPMRPDPARTSLPVLVSAATTEGVELAVDAPPDGSAHPAGEPVFVAGRAFAPLGAFRRFDVVFVIDTSASTARPAGGGSLSAHTPLVATSLGASHTPIASILATEVAAARALLQSVDLRGTRIGVVTFAGEVNDPSRVERSRRGHARTIVPLTHDADVVEGGLEEVLHRGPGGQTHMASALGHARRALTHGADADPESEKVIVFLTDGVPTLPVPWSLWENEKATLRAADGAALDGARIFSYGVGPDALSRPAALIEMAERTGGIFTPVRHPSDLEDAIRTLRFGRLEAVEVANRTTGGAPRPATVNPDGSWGALVPLKRGRNELEVTARAREGEQQTLRLVVVGRKHALPPPAPIALVPLRSRLLEERLETLRDERRGLEHQVAEAQRRSLVLEIQRERTRAHRSTASQRRSLDLEIRREDEAR